MWKRILSVPVLIVAAYLLLWPVPITPVAWQAPSAPALESDYAANEKLASARSLAIGTGIGSATILPGRSPHLYAGYQDGRVVRFDLDGDDADLIARIDGRPLGMAFSANGDLLIASGDRGLLRLDPESGRLQTLSDQADTRPVRFAAGLAVAQDGSVYFADASNRFDPIQPGRAALFEHGAHGRLLRYRPGEDTTTVLLENLQVPAGVALAADESFLLVAETGNYDIIRYWLRGPRRGQREQFIANLPGFPAGLSRGENGIFWVAIAAPRNRALDAMSNLPLLRKLVYRLPGWMLPRPDRQAFVLGLDEAGKVVYNLQDRGGDAFSAVVSAHQYGGKLYLGSLTEDHFAVYPLDESHHRLQE